MYLLHDACHPHHLHLKTRWPQRVYRVARCGAVVDGGAPGARRAADTVDTAAPRLVFASPAHYRA